MEHRKSCQDIAWFIGFAALVAVFTNGREIIRSVTDILGLFQSFWIGIAIAFVFNRPYDFLREKYYRTGKIKLVFFYCSFLSYSRSKIKLYIQGLLETVLVCPESGYCWRLQSEQN